MSAESYREWAAGQGSTRHIVTLLSRRIRGEEIARLSEVVARHGLSIDKITRLSGRVSLDAENTADKAYIANHGDLAEGCAAQHIHCTVSAEGKSYTIAVPSQKHSRTFQTRAK